MASTDDLKTAVGCLSTVFPQFVAKELAGLTDQIATAIQGFTDPLAAIGDLHVDKLLDDVASISQGDIFGNLAGVAVGLGAQYAKRELTDYLGSMADEFPSVTKRVQQIRNLSGKVASSVTMMMSLFPDVPYAVAQHMCQTIIEADELKVQNLSCLRKHIVQLVNAIMILAKNANIKDKTFANLQKADDQLKLAQVALSLSQHVVGAGVVFDSHAFERSRQALLEASALLTPDKDGTTVMDLAEIAAFGSVAAGDISTTDQKLTLLVISSLSLLIEAEVGAVVSQVQVINFYVTQMGSLISSYRRVGQHSQIQTQRARAIRQIQTRLGEIIARIDLALDRGSLRAASGEMLLWASRVKSILVTMDSIKNLTLQEGSIEGPDKALLLQQEFQLLLTSLTSIEDDVTIAGIENPLTLRDQVFALTKGARRLMKDIEDGRTNESHLATFHALALVTATKQASRTEASATVATRQKTICERFASIDMEFGPRYDDLLDSLRQLGLDRGVDMLNSGAFSEFLDVDLSMLSYVGTAIECLKHGIQGTDDAQTRAQLNSMRDDLIAKRSNMEIAAADSADQGRSRLIDRLKTKISTVQKNAKTVESIVADMKGLLSAAGESLDQSLDGLAKFNALLGNADQLAVAAGGRLAAGLEEFSEQPNAGVVACDLP
jgi:hypothetical protein